MGFSKRHISQLFPVLVLCFILLTVPAFADQENTENTLILRASTLGIGLEAGRDFGDYRVRLGGHFFTINSEQTIGGIDYDIEAKLAYGSFIIDWYPRQEGFHLSAGLLYNADDIKARSKDAAYYNIAGNPYPVSDTGRLVADVEYSTIAPYGGFGWEGAFSKTSPLGWLVEAGVSYLGKNTVYLESEGMPAGLMSEEIWAGELSQEAHVIQDYFDKYRFLPVVTLGLTYAF